MGGLLGSAGGSGEFAFRLRAARRHDTDCASLRKASIMALSDDIAHITLSGGSNG